MLKSPIVVLTFALAAFNISTVAVAATPPKPPSIAFFGGPPAVGGQSLKFRCNGYGMKIEFYVLVGETAAMPHPFRIAEQLAGPSSGPILMRAVFPSRFKGRTVYVQGVITTAGGTTETAVKKYTL